MIYLKEMVNELASWSLGLTKNAPSLGIFLNKASALDLLHFRANQGIPSCLLGCGTGSRSVIRNS